MPIQKHSPPRPPSDSSQQSIPERNGFVTLISILVVGVVGLAIATSLLLLSLSSSHTSFSEHLGAQARALANACAETALHQLKASLSYAGNESLTLPTGTCTIRPVLGSGNMNRTIQATGTSGTATRKISIVISQVQPQIQIATWQEVADFN